MSIIVVNDYGWFICCKKFMDSLYSSCEDENTRMFMRYKFREAFFGINTPFLMNSESQKLGKGKHVFETYQRKKIAKQRKKNLKKTNADAEEEEFINKGFTLLVSVAKESGYLDDHKETEQEWFDNNSKARQAASEILNYNNSSLNSELHYESPLPHPVIKKFGDDRYLIPAFSSFEICDISKYFRVEDKKYDLVLIDPPWINKSVKRKRSYCQIKYDCLQNLEIEKIINPGCLLVVWATNSPSSTSFVVNELFPKCDVICSTVWHWCKITRKGKLIHPLQSHHKKPYEKIILGRVSYDLLSTLKPAEEIGPEKLIVSVPSSIHSHKPPLAEILKPYVVENAQCLELFGRYLLPKWKTVGNEALKLQNVKLFEADDGQSKCSI